MIGAQARDARMATPYSPDAEFTPSSFGGGWLKPFNEAGDDLVERLTGERGEAPWPEGWIIEPFEVQGMVEWAEVMGVALEGAC